MSSDDPSLLFARPTLRHCMRDPIGRMVNASVRAFNSELAPVFEIPPLSLPDRDRQVLIDLVSRMADNRRFRLELYDVAMYRPAIRALGRILRSLNRSTCDNTAQDVKGLVIELTTPVIKEPEARQLLIDAAGVLPEPARGKAQALLPWIIEPHLSRQGLADILIISRHSIESYRNGRRLPEGQHGIQIATRCTAMLEEHATRVDHWMDLVFAYASVDQTIEALLSAGFGWEPNASGAQGPILERRPYASLMNLSIHGPERPDGAAVLKWLSDLSGSQGPISQRHALRSKATLELWRHMRRIGDLGYCSVAGENPLVIALDWARFMDTEQKLGAAMEYAHKLARRAAR